VTEFFKKRLCFWVTNPNRTIVTAWYLSLVSPLPPSSLGLSSENLASSTHHALPPPSYSQVLVFIAFIIACVSASNMSKQPTGKAAGFAGVWTVLLLVAISGLGQWVMRKGLTELSIGFFLGVLFIMVHQMLILFAIFVDRSKIPNQDPGVVSSQQAMATFSFFLFLVYMFFGTLLGVYREDVLKKDDVHDGDGGELEPGYDEEQVDNADNTM